MHLLVMVKVKEERPKDKGYESKVKAGTGFKTKRV